MRKLKMTFIGLNLCLLIFIGLSFAASFQIQELESNERIVGGRLTKNHDKPYMALVRFRAPHEGRLAYFTCGGNVITDQWVLSVAHCVPEGSKEYVVHMGMNTWCKRYAWILDFSDGHEQRDAVRVIKHPEYVNHTSNDIALLKMDRPITLGGNIQAARLPDYFPQAGRNLTVAGWGRTSEYSYFTQCKMLEVVVQLFSQEVCEPYLNG